MKRQKKFLVISAVSLCLLGTLQVYISQNNNIKAEQQNIINENETVKVQRGNIKTVVEAGGKVSLSDKNGTNSNSIIITLSTNQYDISKLQINQTVNVKLKAFPDDNIIGKITEVSNKANEGNNPTYTITVSVDNPVMELGENTHSNVTVRKGPSKEYMEENKIEKGEVFYILEKKNNWVKIRLKNNTEGWVSKATVKSKGLEKENIKSNISKKEVILRKSNSSGSKNLRKLVQGEKVNIIDKKYNWYKVELSDKTTGWLQEEDLILQKLIDGMSVTGTILVHESKNILKVPISTVQKDEKGYYVTIVKTNEKRYIEVGESDSESIEVTKGLSDGEIVSIQSPVSSNENPESNQNMDRQVD
ncbi:MULTISPECIES: SH3 domain-containing protein [unclassified Clostridioides]|uniref:SH3 domain-containing protein n=1 Tax=unclassified Clostridioides TaxID=2635829 RepID=UPI001D0FDCB6|nr:SH3 domain-containing protein [Clostridioides sp. ES-S-0171-01]MCC0687284.1 SH3 domain-containing protein [Clostridioides sp. ES-S-0056-01]UDN56159.1 SH3 domain-containing protein [Clostridioides sp. ES-S-0054-01]